MGNQKPTIGDGQTIHFPKETGQRNKQRSAKYHEECEEISLLNI